MAATGDDAEPLMTTEADVARLRERFIERKMTDLVAHLRGAGYSEGRIRAIQENVRRDIDATFAAQEKMKREAFAECKLDLDRRLAEIAAEGARDGWSDMAIRGACDGTRAGFNLRIALVEQKARDDSYRMFLGELGESA